MAETDKLFAGSIPKFYEEFLVPMIFRPYAEDLARRVSAHKPANVLETAAGTGVVSRALAAKLSASARYTVTDLNQPMLDIAKERQGNDPRIAWQQADALSLPFADATFDAVCCQFGVMFFPDRVKGYREAKRVLKPGSRFLFNVWDRIEENVFALEVTNTLAAMFPGDPPRFLARTPHGYHDESVIRAELGLAGFTDVAIERRADVSRSLSARHVATAYCQGTPLRSEIEARGPDRLQEATDLATAAIAERHGTGEAEGKIQALVVTAQG